MKSNCAFCGDDKNPQELIKGKDGAICAQCAGQANEYFHEQNDSKEMITKPHPESNTQTGGGNPKEMKGLTELKQALDKKVIGQEAAKRQLLVEFYKHFRGIQTNKNNAFLIGNSGVGKTHLVRSLSQVLDIRLIEFDATMFSETGYKGKDVLEIIDDAFQQCGEDVDLLKKSVIFIDEIDKILTTTNVGAESKIQQSLLKMVEGIEIPLRKMQGRRRETVMVNTKDLQFVVAGACVGLEEQVKKRNNPTQVGFNIPGRETVGDGSESVSANDLIDFGFIPEFIGRFPLIIQLEPLTKEDYISILKNGEHSVVKDYINVFQQENIVLEVDENALELMAEQVQESNLGFRSVQSTLTKRLNDMLFDSITLKRDKIVLDRNSLINDDNLECN